MINILKKQLNCPPLLWKCLLASTGLHLTALVLFYNHPLLLQSPFSSFFSQSIPEPIALKTQEDLQLIEKNQQLDEVFKEVLVLSPQLQHPFDLAEAPKGIALSPLAEEPSDTVSFADNDLFLTLANPQDMQTAAAAEPIILPKTSIAEPLIAIEDNASSVLPQIELDRHYSITDISELSSSTDLFETRISQGDFSPPSDVILEASQENVVEGVALWKRLESIPKERLSELPEIKSSLEPHLPALASKEIATNPSFHKKVTLHVSKASTVPPETWEKRNTTHDDTLSSIEDYSFPKLASAQNWNDDFDLEVHLTPKGEDAGGGYLFSLALKPNFDLSAHTLKQNFYFLIDRSNSIEKHRFAVFKRAVLKAMASMQEGDKFNLYIFDKKIVRLSDKNLSYNLKTLQKAEDFLEKQEHGGLFASADIFTNLKKILPDIQNDGEVHTAILLTDGNTLLNTPKQHKFLSEWIEKNNGKVDLYTAAAAQKNNLLMLDMLSTLSGGKLIYSDTNTSFPRKLAKLILTLREPVAKELILAAIPSDSSAQLELYPATRHLPSLYSHQPYTLYGSINEPTSFDIVLQGRHGDHWIAIKKNVSFVEAEKGDRFMQKKCAARQVTMCYDKFINEGKAKHLQDAKEILKKAGGDAAFE